MSDVEMEISPGRWVPAVPLRIPRWWHYLTGGRPMDLIGEAFRDIVVGEMVYYYQDAFGRRWMAFSGWSWFRCPLPPRVPRVPLGDQEAGNG